MDTILKSAINILEQNTLLTLTTVDKNQPCSCTAYYVFDEELNLYIWTDPQTLHCKNIERNPKVSVSIFNSGQEWGSFLQGLQTLGKAIVVSEKELTKAGNLYLQRYPQSSNFVKTPKDFHSEKFQSRIYKIELEKIKVLDEKIFGKEEFRELTIKRS
ncbi:MAG: pyridoxamine 5'-phosphate oxidase family protein [Candidatus Aenigmarchaeota archaeon]|nr:pyridoxamine 5'-phosphate oxidase family protein [Candidatus Aenigmarchaeota archaeon]